MTTIDTLKLKEGMFCKFKYYGKDYEGKIEIDGTGIKVHSSPIWLYIATRAGEIATGITDIVFPDLQEQDRVEAWEPKPWDVIRWNNFGNIIEAPLLFKWKQWFIVDLNGSPLSIHADQVAPKVKNIDERLEEILGEFETSTTSMTMQEAISQIKSLLAAKVQNVTMGEFLDVYRKFLISTPELAAWHTFNHFTKNETK